MERVKKYFEDFPEILLLGFGREGSSSYQLLRRLFPEKKIGIADRNEDIPEELPQLQQDHHLKLHAGKDYLKHLSEYDLVIKSPGVKLTGEKAKEIKLLSSQTDIFLRFFGKHCIGVTGTKGKSTTSSLIAHILRQESENVFLMGNIGEPPFDFIHRINDGTQVVFELSSHQLLDVQHAPHIGILLNLYDEHLDFYNSKEDYFRAKFNIFKYQGSDDFAIINGDDHKIPNFLQETNTRANVIEFTQKSRPGQGCYLKDEMICYTRQGEDVICMERNACRQLIGKHNLNNLMAAITASVLMGTDAGTLHKALTSFKGLPHRLEYTGSFGGIHFYNDSIATIPEASIAALESLPDTDSLILGGFDRGLNYDSLAAYLAKSSISNLIFMGPAGKRMMNLLETYPGGKRKLYQAQNMHDAIQFARSNTVVGKICLLSPAAASYDQYKSFEERGMAFKKEAERI